MQDDFHSKSNQIRQLAGMPTDQLIDQLSNEHSNLSEIAPNIAPEIHSTAINAIQYLNSKLPHVGNELAQDTHIPPSKAQKTQWLDLYDTVNNPISVLDHVKNSTLNRHHMEIMKTIYPELHQEMVSKMNEHLGDLKMKEKELPYRLRATMGMFMGQPLDSTMTVPVMQSVINSNRGAISQETQQPGNSKKASGVELKQINKVDALYETPSQARQINKKD
jgi:hypothetical protein